MSSSPYSFFWPELPVLQKRSEIIECIQKNPVTILQADTGSGKTTQLPKLCLEAGLADKGLIGLTQPRRIAALSITDRLREEMRSQTLVGSRIRFRDDMPKEAKVKVMTDGILLQEFHRDPLLRRYSCIILDEAHERSLNIDFLLGIFHGVLKKRSDFRLVISSATLDADAFSKFYNNAPVIIAEGRCYPVDIEYRNESTTDSTCAEDTATAAEELLRETRDHCLCFLPTERDILEAREVLEKRLQGVAEILPLFGRMTPAEQKKIFSKASKPRIILATNIAETSVTIPGIASVVDAGLARISRYNSRVQGLPIEEISRASAEQRAGRAGRTKPGRCIRLYTREDFESRTAYTEPEILRSGLESVVLRLKSLGFDPESFPFLQRPRKGAFREASHHLFELSALDSTATDSRVTRLGRKMSTLPMDVTLARIVLKGQELGIALPVTVIAAGLAIQDPKILPREGKERACAESKHGQWKHKCSDLLGLLRLWNFVHEEWSSKPTWNRLSKICRENWLSFPRMREWFELYGQFRYQLGIDKPAEKVPENSFHEDAFHKAFLSGFLGHLASKIPREYGYLLPGGREGHIFPGSGLFKKNPQWIACTELRETSKLWMSRSFIVHPEWILELVPEQCTTSWMGESFNPSTGFVEALERISFRGLVVQPGKRVQYQKVEPERCREIFWDEAIVQGKLKPMMPFQNANCSTLAKLAARAKKLRRPDLVPENSELLSWYLTRAEKISDKKSLRDFMKKHGDDLFRFSLDDWSGSQVLQDYDKYLPGEKAATDKLVFPKTINAGHRKAQVAYTEERDREPAAIVLHLDAETLCELELPTLFLSLPSWRKRIFDWFCRHQAPGPRKWLSEMESDVIPLWSKKVKKDYSILLALIHAAESIDPEQGLQLKIPKQRDDSLLVRILLDCRGRKFSLRISPWTSRSESFSLRRKALRSAGFQPLPIPFEGLFFLPPGPAGSRFSWSLDRDEANFIHEIMRKVPENTDLLPSSFEKIMRKRIPLHTEDLDFFFQLLKKKLSCWNPSPDLDSALAIFCKPTPTAKLKKNRTLKSLQDLAEPSRNSKTSSAKYARAIASILLDRDAFVKAVKNLEKDASTSESFSLPEKIFSDPVKTRRLILSEQASTTDDKEKTFLLSLRKLRPGLMKIKQQLLNPDPFPENLRAALDRLEKGKGGFQDAVEDFLQIELYRSKLQDSVYSRPRERFSPQEKNPSSRKLDDLSSTFGKL